MRDDQAADLVRTENIAFEDAETEATLSATIPEYLERLKVGARVQLLQGRFLESRDMNSDEEVIVLSNELATKLFLNVDSVGESVKVNRGSWKVVGVVASGAFWGSDVKHDAYVPLNSEGSESASQAYIRFRIEMESLDQVKNAQSFIRSSSHGTLTRVSVFDSYLTTDTFQPQKQEDYHADNYDPPFDTGTLRHLHSGVAAG